MITILPGVKWNLNAVLICKDIEHFLHLFIGELYFSEKSVLSSFAHLLIGWFTFLLCQFLSFSYSLEIKAPLD